jgi:hypothetical protein
MRRTFLVITLTLLAIGAYTAHQQTRADLKRALYDSALTCARASELTDLAISNCYNERGLVEPPMLLTPADTGAP